VEKHNGQYQPTCLLAHSLINKLSIIVGRCDLLREEALEESECYQSLMSIQEVARSMAEEITQHQCKLEAIARASDIKNPLPLSDPEPSASQN
jgi:hypothetical protein